MNLTNPKRYRLLFIFALISIVGLSGCVGSRQGTSWPAISLVELNGEQQIAVAYNGQVEILNPDTGKTASLLNSDGEVRRNENNDPLTWVLNGGDYDNAQFFASPIILDDETYLIADYNNRLLAVDSIRADVVDITPIDDHVLADMLLVDGVLYVPMSSTGVMAMRLEDSEVLWSYATEDGVWAQPINVDNQIIFSSVDHYLYSVDKDSGELLWQTDLEGGVASAPLFANDRLYVGSFNKKFFELSLDGEILNAYDTQNWVWGTPAIDDNGVVYVTDLSGYVHALDTNDNLSVVWSVQASPRGIRPGPIVYDDRVIVASRDGIVHWLDKRDGLVVNDQEIEGKPELLGNLLLLEPSDTLKIDQPLIVVSSTNTGELLIAFEVDGRQMWVHKR